MKKGRGKAATARNAFTAGRGVHWSRRFDMYRSGGGGGETPRRRFKPCRWDISCWQRCRASGYGRCGACLAGPLLHIAERRHDQKGAIRCSVAMSILPGWLRYSAS